MNHIVAGLAGVVIAAASVPAGSVAPSRQVPSTAPGSAPATVATSSTAGAVPPPADLTTYAAAAGATVGFSVADSTSGSVCTVYFGANPQSAEVATVGKPCALTPSPSVAVTGSAQTTGTLAGAFVVPVSAVAGAPYNVYLVVCSGHCLTRRTASTNQGNRLFESPFTVPQPSIHANKGPIRPSTDVVITGVGFTPPQPLSPAKGCVLSGDLGPGTCTVAANGTLSGTLRAPNTSSVGEFKVTAVNTVFLRSPGPPQTASTTVEVVPVPQPSSTRTTGAASSTPHPSPDTRVTSRSPGFGSVGRSPSVASSSPGGHHGNQFFAWPLGRAGTAGLGVGLLLLAAAVLATLAWRHAHVQGRQPDVQVHVAARSLPTPVRSGSRHPPMLALDLRLKHLRTTWFDPRREA